MIFSINFILRQKLYEMTELAKYLYSDRRNPPDFVINNSLQCHKKDMTNVTLTYWWGSAIIRA